MNNLANIDDIAATGIPFIVIFYKKDIIKEIITLIQNKENYYTFVNKNNKEGEISIDLNYEIDNISRNSINTEIKDISENNALPKTIIENNISRFKVMDITKMIYP